MRWKQEDPQESDANFCYVVSSRPVMLFTEILSQIKETQKNLKQEPQTANRQNATSCQCENLCGHNSKCPFFVLWILHLYKVILSFLEWLLFMLNKGRPTKCELK